RRRHTRFSRDWSSDVCSSDLIADRLKPLTDGIETYSVAGGQVSYTGPVENDADFSLSNLTSSYVNGRQLYAYSASIPANQQYTQIGRASCRERAQIAGHGEAA